MTMASTMQTGTWINLHPDFKISLAGCFGVVLIRTVPISGSLLQDRAVFPFIWEAGASKKPVHARKILDNISENGVEKTLAYVLDQYRAKASLKERLCSVIEKVGLEAFIPPEEMILPFVVKDEEDDFLQFAGL